jgi:long-subunit acyl-CoA synthetase (AMP-forming)
LAYREVKDGVVGEYKSYTYRETAEMVAKAGSGLNQLGLKMHGRLGICSANCVEWMVSLQVTS